jgi:hypothetical protein
MIRSEEARSIEYLTRACPMGNWECAIIVYICRVYEPLATTEV